MSLTRISGLQFERHNGILILDLGSMKLLLNYEPEFKCTLSDENDTNKYHFSTVHAAHAFAKRKRYGRTYPEHCRAEMMTATRERMEWSVKDLAYKLNVSPRTVEAWSSGCRAVPESITEKLESF